MTSLSMASSEKDAQSTGQRRRMSRSERLQEVWGILTECATKALLDNHHGIVAEPISRLERTGITHSAAISLVNELEAKGYVQKRFGDRRRILDLILLKRDLGRDILGEFPVDPDNGGHPMSSVEEISSVSSFAVPVGPHEDERTAHQDEEQCVCVPPNGLPQKGVVLLVDYDNIAIGGGARGGLEQFPAAELLNAARNIGNLIMAFVFVPATCSMHTQRMLRISGFRIFSCPSLKERGKDTVDKTIEEMVEFFLALDQSGAIDTFVIASGDGDFLDAQTRIKNRRKQCMIMYFNEESMNNNLRLEAGDNLMRLDGKERREKEESPSFSAILQERKRMPDDIHWQFLSAIAQLLREYHKDTINKNRRKQYSLKAMTKFIWKRIPPKFYESFSRDKYEEALRCFYVAEVLSRVSSAWHRGTDGPHYYEFNETSEVLLFL